MKKIVIILIMILICGCSNSRLTDKELESIINENNYILIDVREKIEYDELHIENSINIPYDKINKDIDLDKNKIILLYCASGKRSNIAYNTLKDLGYNVYDLGSINNINLEKIPSK